MHPSPKHRIYPQHQERQSLPGYVRLPWLLVNRKAPRIGIRRIIAMFQTGQAVTWIETTLDPDLDRDRQILEHHKRPDLRQDKAASYPGRICDCRPTISPMQAQ